MGVSLVLIGRPRCPNGHSAHQPEGDRGLAAPVHSPPSRTPPIGLGRQPHQVRDGIGGGPGPCPHGAPQPGTGQDIMQRLLSRCPTRRSDDGDWLLWVGTADASAANLQRCGDILLVQVAPSAADLICRSRSTWSCRHRRETRSALIAANTAANRRTVASGRPHNRGLADRSKGVDFWNA